MEMSPKPRLGASPCWIALVLLSIATSAGADPAYRFAYSFAPGSQFFETASSRQESGGKLISSFEKTVEFRVSQAAASAAPTVTAQITRLSNKGRRIDYYEGVRFRANISVKGEISNYVVSGGLPRYRELIQVSAPANRTNIFWMPRFPDEPMRLGDSFSHSAAVDNAEGETIYKLHSVEGHLAHFRLRNKGALMGGSVSGEQVTEGSAVFDRQKGRWSSFELRGEGTAHMAGVVSAPYKISIHKEITDAPKGRQAAHPCERLRFNIGERVRALERLDRQDQATRDDIERREGYLRLDAETVAERYGCLPSGSLPRLGRLRWSVGDNLNVAAWKNSDASYSRLPNAGAGWRENSPGCASNTASNAVDALFAGRKKTGANKPDEINRTAIHK
ncbi:MAG: hypothetical protein ABW080_20295 [Candidatus Thiodiazotropha sp.]